MSHKRSLKRLMCKTLELLVGTMQLMSGILLMAATRLWTWREAEATTRTWKKMRRLTSQVTGRGTLDWMKIWQTWAVAVRSGRTLWVGRVRGVSLLTTTRSVAAALRAQTASVRASLMN